MRKQNVIVGLLVATAAFGTLFIYLSSKAPEFVRWYCQGQAMATDVPVYSCIEEHKNPFIFGGRE